VTDVDSTLAAALERLAPRVPASPDWGEVLNRAGARRYAVRWAALALAAALVALAAAPAFGLHGLFRADKRPRVHFAAELQAVAGSGSGSFTAEPLHSFWHVQHGTTRLAGFSRPLRFTLRFDGLSGPATSARLVVAPPRRGRMHGYSVRLCSPCASGAHGVLRRRGLILAFLPGRATVVVVTARHPDGELRGQVVPRR
jgi:hypothetical protein